MRERGADMTIVRRTLAVLATVVLTALPALAQEVVGRTVVDGRNVDLLADGTWVYADVIAGDETCRQLADGLSFCGDRSVWMMTQPPNPEILRQFRYDDRHYAQIVDEALGIEDGMTADAVRGLTIRQAAGRTGRSPEDVPILDSFPTTVDGRDANAIAFFLEVDGLPVVFLNSITSMPRRTVQTMTFAIGRELTDEHRAIHDAFISEIRFGAQ